MQVERFGMTLIHNLSNNICNYIQQKGTPQTE